ncbi:MAG: adenylyl-sulfate kinase [Pirellulaceae bacterium]|nr:adenylyl-sulfate kinase [Pirellulaceae bacterium]
MSSPTDPKVVWHESTVTRASRELNQGHRAGVVWFTGLSGSGKSTIANAVDQILYHRGIRTLLLDGDNVRHGLCATPALLKNEHGELFAKRFGLGFSAEDREENIRRVGSAAGLLVSAGLIVLTAFVSPYRKDRDRVRQSISETLGHSDGFLEVFVDTPLDVCESRDPKGLYQQARAGKIANFTGISDPYEAPISSELVLAGDKADPRTLAELTVALLTDRGWIS